MKGFQVQLVIDHDHLDGNHDLNDDHLDGNHDLNDDHLDGDHDDYIN